MIAGHNFMPMIKHARKEDRRSAEEMKLHAYEITYTTLLENKEIWEKLEEDFAVFCDVW